jgi:galactitol-specific phosphotransferase system IIC component
MAERQMEHRILAERKIISGDYIQSYLGIAAGFLLSVMIILGGIYLIIQGHDWAGGILIGLDLVGLATVFVLGSNSRRGARSEMLERIPESDQRDD